MTSNRREAPEALPKLLRSAMLGDIVVREDVSTERAEAEVRKTYTVAISSEYPVERFFGDEILDHSGEAVDLERFNNGGAVLLDHDTREQVGVIESAWLDDDRVLRGEIRFSRVGRGPEVEADVVDGIRRHISVGYRVREMRLEESTDERDVYRVTRWAPMELSFVSVPADPTVGVGRSAEGEEVRPVRVIRAESPAVEQVSNLEVETMEATAKAPEAARVEGGEDRSQVAAEIVRLAVQYGMGDKAADWIAAGRSVSDVKSEILAATSSRAEALRAPVVEEKRAEYSYVRAIRGALALQEGGEFDGFEREVHDELARSIPRRQRADSILIPMQTRAAIDSVTAGAASELVFQQSGQLIDLLRSRMVVTRMGATFLPGLTSPVGFPRMTSDGSGSGVTENPVSDVAESEVGTELVTLSPKTYQATQAVTRQLLAQESYNAEALIRNAIAAVHARAWDRAALHGAGAGGEPQGIFTASGVNSVAVGATASAWYGKLVDMMTNVAIDNADFGALGWVTTPVFAGALMQTLDFDAAAAGSRIWTGTFEEGVVAGYRAIASNQVAGNLGAGSNEDAVFFGNWADLMVGTWGALEIIVDPYSKKKRGIVELTSFQLVDIALRHPESFCIGTGVALAPPA